MSDEKRTTTTGGTNTEGSEGDDQTSCDDGSCDLKRRRLLGVVASGGPIALAGCLGLYSTPEPGSPRGYEDIYDLNFLRQRKIIEVRGSQTILGAGEEQGWDLPYVCRAGFCGVCLAKAEDDANEVVHMAMNDFDLLTDEAVEDGYFLPCTSQPRDDATITTHVDWGELDPYQEEEEDPDEEDDADEDAAVHSIEYVNEEVTIYVPEERDLLRTGEDAGLDLPYLCRDGWCGECLAQIDGDARELVEMTVNDYDPLDDEAMADGYTLTCTGHPRGEFSIESGKYQEEDWSEG